MRRPTRSSYRFNPGVFQTTLDTQLQAGVGANIPDGPGQGPPGSASVKSIAQADSDSAQRRWICGAPP